MPQLFQVLRCFKCSVFQVHQTKKTNKWECKLCGEKQSVKRHYGLGTAKDCRIHVQKLNSMRGDIDELKCNQDQESDDSENENYNEMKNIMQSNKEKAYQPTKDSKWSNFVEDTECIEENHSNENMSLDDVEVVLEIPKKRRKQSISNSKIITRVNSTVGYKNIEENHNNLTPPNTDLIEACNTISIENKLSQTDILSEDLTIEKKDLNVKKPIKYKFIPPVLIKNSKWEEFTEDAEECETIMAAIPSINTSKNNVLFSLCDDRDLDNVLNI